MQLDGYFEPLAADDIRIKGTRIGIETVLYEHIHRGRTPEQIYATILYYLRNRPTVEAYLTGWLEYGHQMRATSQGSPLPGLRQPDGPDAPEAGGPIHAGDGG